MGINWAKTNGRIQHGFIKLHRAKNNVRGRSWKHLKEDFKVSAKLSHKEDKEGSKGINPRIINLGTRRR